MVKYYKLGDFNEFLGGLMDNKIVEAVVVPMKGATGESYSPFLIKNVDLLKDCEPIAPVMSVNSARVVSNLTIKGALPFKTAVVLKPCELASFRELIKLNQISPENLLTISFDCEGINYLKDNENKREICEICTHFTPEFADIQIFSYGTDETLVASENIDLKELKLKEIDFSQKKREDFIEKLKKERESKREEKLSSIKDSLKDLLKNCIVCKNCMRVCPICFCQECFFESPSLKGNSVTYSLRANRLHGLDFPENKLLFHLGRMNHMSVSCVSCGACEDACPAEIPVAQIFAAAGDELKKLFDYYPGKDLDEKVPFTCYQHDELHGFEKPYVEKLN